MFHELLFINRYEEIESAKRMLNSEHPSISTDKVDRYIRLAFRLMGDGSVF